MKIMNRKSLLLLMGFLVMSLWLFTVNSITATYKIDWEVLDSGGADVSSSNHQLRNSAGQPQIGRHSGGRYVVESGFWSINVSFIAGDVNGNGQINLTDDVWLANYLLKNGPCPIPFWAGDVNCSGNISLVDAVYLANYLLKNGPALCGDP